MSKLLLSLSILFLAIGCFAQGQMSRFDRFLPKKDSVQNGQNKISHLIDGIATFNTDTTPWGTWSGWAVSSYTDSLTGDYTNQYSAITGNGVNGSPVYLIAYDNPKIKLNKAQTITGMFITNATYTDSTIVNGNGFSKKFGGVTGDDPDYFYIRAIGLKNLQPVDSSDFYLADYTSKNNAGDFSFEEWKWWDLSTLGEIDSIYFTFHSSDIGQFGINTPTYFCIDNFNGIAPSEFLQESQLESFQLAQDSFYNGADLAGGFSNGNAFYVNNYNPSWQSWSGFAYSNKKDIQTAGLSNQYSAYAGGGYHSETYAVANGFGDIVLELPYTQTGQNLKGMMLTNATYTALSMLNGDGFAKKFGGTSGDEKDWLKIDIIGYNYHNEATDTVAFYLADYRFDDNSHDYIIKDWTWVDLTSIKNAVRLEFELSSSDNGQFGMNTPSYFCMDNFHMGNPISTGNPYLDLLTVFPNPAKNILNLTYNTISKQARFVIFSVTGQKVLSGNYTSQLQIENLNTGMYIIQIQDGDQFISSKFQKL